jgi:hypothetical protein
MLRALKAVAIGYGSVAAFVAASAAIGWAGRTLYEAVGEKLAFTIVFVLVFGSIVAVGAYIHLPRRDK